MALMSAPPRTSRLYKALWAFWAGMTAPHPQCSGWEGGRLQEACGVLFKTTGQSQSGMAWMPVSCSSHCSPHPRGQKIDLGQKIVVYTWHTITNVLGQKGGLTQAFPKLHAEISDCSSGARCGAESNHSGKSSPSPEEQLTLDHLHTVEQVYVSWPDLQDAAAEDPEFFTEGSGLVQDGK